MRAAPALTAALAAVTVAAAGYATVVRPAEDAVAERTAAVAAARARLDARPDAGRAERVRRERAELARALAADGVDAPPAAIVARFLRSLAAVGTLDGVRVTGIAAGSASVAAPPVARATPVVRPVPMTETPAVAPAAPIAHAGPAAPVQTGASEPSAFDEIPLHVALAGPYVAVVRALRDIAAHPPAARLTVASLAGTTPARGGRTEVHALLDVRLQRLARSARDD